MGSEKSCLPATLLVLLSLYGAASLFHHVHNAEFLAEYPNMPVWLTRAKVYAAWLGVTALGVLGYGLLRWRYRLAGFAFIAAYGAMGFDGLGHYSLAAFSEHTMTMNLTIGLEVASGALLCFAAVRFLAKGAGLGAVRHEV
jgi:hypothetical protein